MKFVACKNCGWVHFAVSYETAELAVCDFNRYYYALSRSEQKEDYGGNPASMWQYDRCNNCGNDYREFRKALKKEIPNGSTIEPILDYKEKVK